LCTGKRYLILYRRLSDRPSPQVGLPSENPTLKYSTTTPSVNPNGTNQAAINRHYRRAKTPGATDFFTVITDKRPTLSAIAHS
jgi:hypothetical protein